MAKTRKNRDVDPASEAPSVPSTHSGQGPVAPEAADDPARGRQTAAPTCPYHHQPCKAGHSNAFFTYYYCQVDGCAFSLKQQRPNMPRRLHQSQEQEDHSAR